MKTKRNRKWLALFLALCMALPGAADFSLLAEAADNAGVAAANLHVTARYLSNRISWDKVDGATAYKVLRSEKDNDKTGNFAEIGTVETSTDVCEYIDENAGTGTHWYYKVEAQGVQGNPAAEAVQADKATGIEALQAGAVLHKAFAKNPQAGEHGRSFNGQNLYEGTEEEVNRIKDISKGALIVTVRRSAEDSAGVFFAAKNKATTITGDTGDIQASAQLVAVSEGNGDQYRANVGGSGCAGDLSYVVPSQRWSTFVLRCGTHADDTHEVWLSADGGHEVGWAQSTLAGFFTRLTTTSAVDMFTIGGIKNGNTIFRPFKGDIAYVTVTSESLSEAEIKAYETAVNAQLEQEDPSPVAQTPGTQISSMFTEEPDNTWVFTGGSVVSGGFEQTRGMRNYVGEFEEYVRWRRAGGTGDSPQRMRYTIVTAKNGRTLKDVVENYEEFVGQYAPRAAAFMVGVEDYQNAAEADLATFKDNLKKFIDESLKLRNGTGFVVIQKPFATTDAASNTKIEAYCKAVDEVVAAYSSDAGKFARIVVVDHYTQTKGNTTFQTTGLLKDGVSLNGTGHIEIAKELSVATIGGVTDFPVGGVISLTETEQPEEYLNVMPQVTAGQSSLRVEIPQADEISGITGWTYQVRVGNMKIEGEAAGNRFMISALPSGKTYQLTLRSADGKTQITTVKGTIRRGDTAVQNKLTESEMTPAQKALAQKMAEDRPLTWLFMGDSITHAAQHTYAYDGIAQSFEKYLHYQLGREDDIVINTAVSSATTQSTLTYIQYRLENYVPDVMSIMLGTNDCGTNTAVATYKANLEAIIARAKELNPEVLIILRSPSGAWNGREATMPLYNAAMKEVAEEQGLIYVDQFTEFQDALDAYPWVKSNMILYGNNLHPGAYGQLVMLKWMIRECGLWTDDSPILNMAYKEPITPVTSEIEPEFTAAPGSITLQKASLEKKYGNALGQTTVKATSAATGQIYSLTSEAGENVILRNLPDGTYTVVVSSVLETSAQEVTFKTIQINVSQEAQKNFDFEFVFSGGIQTDLSAGADSGVFLAGDLAPAVAYTYTLCQGEGDQDNGSFVIEGNKLKVAKQLTGKEFSIRVKAENKTLGIEKERTFKIHTPDTTGMVFEKQDLQIQQGSPTSLDSESYAAQLREMTSSSIIVKYTSTGTSAIQSLFSISAGTTANNHFHVYVSGGTLGYEIRWGGANYNGSAYSAAGVLRPGEENIIAFKADKESQTYKLFANGQLVHEMNASTLSDGYKFVTDLGTVDSIRIGATKRSSGDASYPFGGTIRDIKVYNRAVSDSELEAMTMRAPEAQQPVSGLEGLYSEWIGKDKFQYKADTWETLQEALSDLRETFWTAYDEEEVEEVRNNFEAAVDTLKEYEKFADIPTNWGSNQAVLDESIWFVSGLGYMTGYSASYPDGKHFGSVDTLTRAQFATAIYRMEGEPEISGEVLAEYRGKFGDVDVDDPKSFFAKAVVWAAQNGIVTGYTDSGLFGVNDPITRQQMATIMFRYAKNIKGLEPTEDDYDDLNSFEDKNQLQNYTPEAMKWCVGQGLITGLNSKTLAPQGNAARAQCAIIIKRFADKNYGESL